MKSSAYFPQVSQSDVSGEMEAIFEDIRLTLRVPWVAFACRVLATFPGYLPLAWRRSSHAFMTRYAENAADELREISLLHLDPVQDLKQRLPAEEWNPEKTEKVRRVLYALNYGNPKYLLFITALSESLQMRSASEGEISPDLRPSLPKGQPEGMDAPLPLVDPNEASTEVQQLLKRAADLHYHHGPASDFQALAYWPDFLQLATEEVLAPVVRTKEYDAKSNELVSRARELVQGLPGPLGVSRTDLTPTCTPNEIAGLTGLLFMYQRFIADITISTVRVTEALDGPAAATKSQFPV